MKHLALAAILSATLVQPALSAQVTIDGEPSAMKLVATGATRAEVIAALAARYRFDVVGGTISDGTLSGEFSGTLGQVLKEILPANGYALAYRNGKPSRVTFTGAGGTEVAVTQPAPLAAPPRAVAPAPSADPPPAVLPTSKKPPREVPISSPAPPPQDDKMKSMTDRAVQQLQELARSIREIKPQ